MKRIYIVTGASGFLGNNIIRMLEHDDNAEVRAFVLNGESISSLNNLKCSIYYGDVTKADTLNSGLGSAHIAAAAAQTKEPVRQGLISMTGTFLDTIIVCTMTGLVLVITGAWSNPELSGASVTNYAFAQGLGTSIGATIVTVGLLFFAFTTILGWCYYGERCFLYLVGIRGIKFYRFVFIVLVGAGSFLTLDLIWILADIVNGLMAFPNLIALIGLRKEIISETKDYFERLKATQHDKDELA